MYYKIRNKGIRDVTSIFDKIREYIEMAERVLKKIDWKGKIERGVVRCHLKRLV